MRENTLPISSHLLEFIDDECLVSRGGPIMGIGTESRNRILGHPLTRIIGYNRSRYGPSVIFVMTYSC
jgi:hypothetical protein